MNTNLYELLRTIPDPRRAQGTRHPLPKVLVMVIMGMMTGATSERALARFVKNNEKDLITVLAIKRNQVPSRSVIAKIMQNVDFTVLRALLHHPSLSNEKPPRLGWFFDTIVVYERYKRCFTVYKEKSYLQS